MSGRLFLMSDVHGYFQPFLKILKEIRFQDADQMVILGDLVAKGPDSLGLLRFVMEHGNILALRGNHEQRLLQYYGIDWKAKIPDSTMRDWVSGDGAEVIRQIGMLSERGRDSVLKFIAGLPFFAEIVTGERTYLLLHGAPDQGQKEALKAVEWKVWLPVNGAEKAVSAENIFPDPAGNGRSPEEQSLKMPESEKEAAWFRIMLPDMETLPKKRDDLYGILKNRYGSPDEANHLPAEMIAVVGHTPTFKYGEQYAGNMIVKEDKIFLDCGAGQGYGLGCLEIGKCGPERSCYSAPDGVVYISNGNEKNS